MTHTTEPERPSLGRPRGDVRTAILDACKALADPAGGATMRELAEYAHVNRDAAKRAGSNLVRCGELSIVGHRATSYCKKPVAVYALPVPAVGPYDGIHDLALVMGALVADSLQAWPAGERIGDPDAAPLHTWHASIG